MYLEQSWQTIMHDIDWSLVQSDSYQTILATSKNVCGTVFWTKNAKQLQREDGKNLIRNNADNQEYLANFAPLMFQPF